MASGFTFGPQPPAPAAEEKAPEEKKPAGPALLWGEDTELDPDNPDYAALMSLKEDLTPDERAEGLKVRPPVAPEMSSERPIDLRRHTELLQIMSHSFCAIVCVKLGLNSSSAVEIRNKGMSASSENAPSTTGRPSSVTREHWTRTPGTQNTMLFTTATGPTLTSSSVSLCALLTRPSHPGRSLS